MEQLAPRKTLKRREASSWALRPWRWTNDVADRSARRPVTTPGPGLNSRSFVSLERRPLAAKGITMSNAGRSCTDAPPKKPPHKARCRRRSRGYFSTVHPAADRDRTAHGRLAGRWVDRLSAIAGSVASERQLSHPYRDRAAAGGRPADHGIDGGGASRVAIRRDPRPYPDDVGECARLCSDHAAIRIEPTNRWGCQRHAVSHQRGESVPADGPAVSAAYPQSQSG
jgi:hypothetical protein